MLNIVIIGAGRGGTSLIQLLNNEADIKIVGVADLKTSSEGIKLAKRLHIPTTTRYQKLVNLPDIQFVIDVSSSKEVHQYLKKLRRPNLEVISGRIARFMWEQIVERVRTKDSIQKLLFQYQSIYDLGLKLTTNQSLNHLLFHVVEDATQLTSTPAGSVALFDEVEGKMSLGAIKGFSDEFSKKMDWKVRKGGLTHSILNSEGPLVIEDIYTHPEFDNPVMLKEGVRSLMASPLIAGGKIIGILYVDDYIVRQFDAREISLFWLISRIAGNSIDNVRMLEKAMNMANTDELTRLYNHRYFNQRLEHEISRASRYNLNLTLAMIDIDDFKQYNDNEGHLVGNSVLRKLSAILMEECRDTDVVARYGGEEFVIIMPETTARDAIKLVDRIRKRVAQYAFNGRSKESERTVTISSGVATYPVNAKTPLKLIERADNALYEAKRLGKNRVVLSHHQEKPVGESRKTKKSSTPVPA